MVGGLVLLSHWQDKKAMWGCWGGACRSSLYFLARLFTHTF